MGVRERSDIKLARQTKKAVLGDCIYSIYLFIYEMLIELPFLTVGFVPVFTEVVGLIFNNEEKETKCKTTFQSCLL